MAVQTLGRSVSQSSSVRVAGRLAEYQHKWRELTLDRFVLDAIAGYHIDLLEAPPAQEVQRGRGGKHFSQQELDTLQGEVETLLQKGAIAEVPDREAHLVSPLFAIPKE